LVIDAGRTADEEAGRGKLPVVPMTPSDQLLLPVPKPPLIPR
jgi:hypothetical protein